MTPVAERRSLLPFVWARAHHFVLLNDGKRCEALCHSDTAARALLEARRLADGPMSVNRLAPNAFKKMLVLSCQRNSAEAHRMMVDIGSELDLYTLAEEPSDTDDLLDSEGDAPIIRLINAMLTETIKEKASDIHIETYGRHLQIRFRVDGMLRGILHPQRRLATLLTSRVRVMTSLDIAEKRIPQDGQMALRIGGRAIDAHVSTLPSSHGERVVLRLLDRSSVNLDLLTLGMPPALLDRADALIAQPHGIVLVTGPTGSGKSATLYTVLGRLDAHEHNITTIEDPVEYELGGIDQTRANARVDMAFARGLRTILRQDPDMVLVGEIHDGETAQIAIQASLTGHLVLSTLHTNSAPGVVSRLQDMDVEPFLLSASLLAVISQRLVRQLYPHYRQPTQAGVDTAWQMAVPVGARLQQPKGCPECNFIGYHGRTGTHGLLLIDDRVRATIRRGENEITLIQQLGPAWQALSHTGHDEALTGITSQEEMTRAIKQQTTESI